MSAQSSTKEQRCKRIVITIKKLENETENLITPLYKYVFCSCLQCRSDDPFQNWYNRTGEDSENDDLKD